MWPYFTYNKITYNLIIGPILYLPTMHTTCYGTNSFHFRGSLIWNNLPRNIKSSKSVSEFKKYHYENNYFPFHGNTYPKRYRFLLGFTFIMECTVITILNMVLFTILLF